MKKNLLSLLVLVIPLLAGCSKTPAAPSDGKIFHYEDISFVDLIGSKTNDETHPYSSLKVNRTEQELREDFAFGVDASMVYVVEKNGGVYYNDQGQEQDVFQILRKAGVNFVRFRLWNKPQNKYKMTYGGGENNFAVDLALAKRAKAANMNVMIDFHYSDFWADPDYQNVPFDWSTLTVDEIPAQIESFTKETLQGFKDNGVTVDAVQIGNEINNGMCGYHINWNDMDTSFDKMANMLKAGINGAKSVFSDIKTIVHLANGGNLAEFETFFTSISNRGVNYDIIGVSYYPHLSGSLSELQENLDNVSSKTGKPVMVVETSWGFTTDYVEGITENTYNEKDEDVGGYLTSEQAQATCIRDICNVLSKVPDNMGLGIFYWEPGWLPVAGACWATAAGQSYQYVGNDSRRSSYEDGLATWSNQGLFSYTGKALSSLKTYSYVRRGFNSASEQSISARTSFFSITINLAAHETLPSTAKVVTDFDAIREVPCTWEDSAIEAVKEKGTHTGLVGLVDGKYEIGCNATCIENFIIDPGFENQGTTDSVKDPWVVEYVTPVNDKVVKLDRKKDIRSGKTDLNWYHSSSRFTFKVSQTISNMPAGSYNLTTYIMGIAYSNIRHNALVLFIQINGGEMITLDLANDTYLQGWTAGYQTCKIENIEVPEGATVKVGLEGDAEAKAWAHNDDWELVKND